MRLLGQTPSTLTTQSTINKYRDSLNGRGSVSKDFWFWPATCSGTGWMINSPAVLETSYAATLPSRYWDYILGFFRK